jgi:Restriction endonuclease
MGRQGSGQDLGRVSELGYRLFARLPDWAAFVLPVVLFVILLETGEAALLGLRGVVGWLQPETNYRVWAFLVAPVVALLVFMVAFEVALLTNVMRTGRWKLLRLQTSLRAIRSLASRDFERLVGAAYELQGYRVDYAPDGPDGGVDLVIHRGGDTVLVQCKNRGRECASQRFASCSAS